MEHPGAQARTVLCTDRSVAAENEDHMARWCTISYNGGEWFSSGFVQLNSSNIQSVLITAKTQFIKSNDQQQQNNIFLILTC